MIARSRSSHIVARYLSSREKCCASVTEGLRGNSRLSGSENMPRCHACSCGDAPPTDGWKAPSPTSPIKLGRGLAGKRRRPPPQSSWGGVGIVTCPDNEDPVSNGGTRDSGSGGGAGTTGGGGGALSQGKGGGPRSPLPQSLWYQTQPTHVCIWADISEITDPGRHRGPYFWGESPNSVFYSGGSV